MLIFPTVARERDFLPVAIVDRSGIVQLVLVDLKEPQMRDVVLKLVRRRDIAVAERK